MTRMVLIGFMGSGKTTVGQLLAAALNCPHIDLDQSIVASTGKSISQIFAEQGEACFRRLESDRLAAALTQEGILSTGGGTPVSLINRQRLIRSDALVIFLKTSPEGILKRLQGDTDRPLLKNMNRTRFITLFQEREGYYHETADIEIVTDDKTPEKIVREIIETAASR
ncbi:shikimate kinase [Sporolactobacillus sp. THM19-2]|nr:shikimate kinase [Sporolactobacillus sp. THM19-2]